MSAPRDWRTGGDDHSRSLAAQPDAPPGTYQPGRRSDRLATPGRPARPAPVQRSPPGPGLDEMLDAFDFEPICYANMPLAQYDYMAHGSDSEFTLRRNRDAFQWVELVDRPGTSPDSVNTATDVLGIKMQYPILIAPSTRQRDVHPDGDSGMYQGATAAGTPMIVAAGSSIPIQKIATSANGPRWSQMYPLQNLDASRDQIELFQANGARAIVVTADQQTSRYERDLHDRHLGGNPRAIVSDESVPSPPGATRGPARY